MSGTERVNRKQLFTRSVHSLCSRTRDGNRTRTALQPHDFKYYAMRQNKTKQDKTRHFGAKRNKILPLLHTDIAHHIFNV